MEKKILIEVSKDEVRAYKQHDNYRELLSGLRLDFEDIFDQRDIDREVYKLSEFIRKIKLQYCEYTIRAIASGLEAILNDERISELQEGLEKYCNIRLHVVPKEQEEN